MKHLKHIKFSTTYASFLGFGIAWQYDRAAFILPFIMFEATYDKRFRRW